MAYYGLLWQPIMAALGIRKHLDIFYDHLSESSLLETTQSLVRFVKNNIFSYSVKANVWQNEKKKTKTQKIVHPTPRYPDSLRRTTWANAGKTRLQYSNYKFWLHGGQR